MVNTYCLYLKLEQISDYMPTGDLRQISFSWYALSLPTFL